jgi:hypothetical protein
VPVATAAPAPGGVPGYRAEQLQSLERQLAQHIGPVAQHLVKRAAAIQPGWEQLITKLADEIDSTPARKQFLDACHALGRQAP